MKVSEIREMSDKDIRERIETEKVNYDRLILNHAISPLENPCQIRMLRKNIARLQTELRERINNTNG